MLGQKIIEKAAEGLGFQKKGWIFYYVDNEEQNTIPVVPDEIMEKLKTLTEDRGFIRRMAWNRVFQSYMNTFARLYGVFDKNWLFTVMKNDCASDDSGESVSTGVVEDGSEDASAEEEADIAEWNESEILIEMMQKVLDRMQ